MEKMKEKKKQTFINLSQKLQELIEITILLNDRAIKGECTGVEVKESLDELIVKAKEIRLLTDDVEDNYLLRKTINVIVQLGKYASAIWSSNAVSNEDAYNFLIKSLDEMAKRIETMSYATIELFSKYQQ